ncbi:MAG TPA: glutathione S-transferase N-terminal domain-containing protein [Thermoleophilaceae bacterium]|jgi:glutathione S-transferase
MSNIEDRPGELVLYTCHIDEGGPAVHPCRRAHDALRKAGHDYRTEVADRNHPFGIFTSGKRPELKRVSGQEKLPVLQLPDGSTVNGSREIIRWAKENAPQPAEAQQA